MERVEKIISLKKTINENFSLTDEELELYNKMLDNDLNFERLTSIINAIIDYKLDKDSLTAFLNYQLYKINPELADEISKDFNQETKKI